jgi:transposase
MVSMDQYLRIRLAHRDGMGINQLARTFHHSKRKIRQILNEEQPRPYPKRPSGPSVLDPFKSLIDALLKADETAPRKQRHTAAKIFRRLRDEHGYSGSAERVRLYVCSQRQQQIETFIPLDHDPGQRLEADFGHIWVDFPHGRQQVAVLLATWAYSNCPFAIALPTERTEAILHGLVEAFAFFQAVPRELWWDNPKTIAPLLFPGRQRGLQPRYAALASHYRFDPLFCLVRQPQEKPRVEGRVKFCQQEWATPVPAVKDLAELNAYLKSCALRDRQRTQTNQSETIGQRFAREQAQALPLSPRPFDACVSQPAQVDKYQTVQFDRNRYSVPRLWAFRTVTVKGYVDQVAIVAGEQRIAQHRRCYGQGELILDPLHYLAVLGRKPAAAVASGWP